MPDYDDLRRRREFKQFCDRYLGLCALSCLVAFAYVGWGAIVAFIGVTVAMHVFREAVLRGGR